MQDDLARLSVKELRQLAAGLGIRGRSGMAKRVLIAAITARRDAVAPLPVDAAHPPASTTAPAPAAGESEPPDPGLPVPDRYGVDTLALMVQDPNHLFAYWEVTPATLAAARTDLGEEGMPILLVYSKFGQEQRLVDLAGGNYYLCITPDTSYRADLGLRDRRGRVRVLASSDTVHSPRNTISGRRDETWAGIDEGFHQLLEMAGLEQRGGSSGLVAGGGGRQVVLDLPSSHDLSSATLARDRRDDPS